MDQKYDDFTTGMFVPEITITKRVDNGHFVATAMGLEVTHHDQAEAVNRLSTKLHEAIQTGQIYPGM